MDSCKNIISAGAQYFNIFINVSVDIPVRGGCINKLCIIAAAPENHILSKALLKGFRRHTCGGGPDRVNDLNAAFDEIP